MSKEGLEGFIKGINKSGFGQMKTEMDEHKIEREKKDGWHIVVPSKTPTEQDVLTAVNKVFDTENALNRDRERKEARRLMGIVNKNIKLPVPKKPFEEEKASVVNFGKLHLPKFAEKVAAATLVFAALNGAVPDVFSNGVGKAVAASPAEAGGADKNVASTQTSDNISPIPNSETETQNQGKKIEFTLGSYEYKTTYSNGEVQVNKMDVQPLNVDGRILLPFRFVAESLGATVSWDSSTNSGKAILGDRTVIFTIGSKVMRIIENGVERSVQMDVAPINKDGRILAPIRFLAEGLKQKVDWDGKTSTASLTALEVMDYTKNPEVVDKVLSYMAGGEFIGFNGYNYPTYKDKSGAIIVFPDNAEIDKRAHAILDGTNYTIADLYQKYSELSGVDKILGNLKKGEVVFVNDNGFYILSEESKKDLSDRTIFPTARFFDRQLNEQKIVDSTIRAGITLDIVFDSKLGIGLTDGYRITHQYDTKTKQFVELSEYKLTGTQEQKVAKTIEENRKSGDQYDTEVVYDGFVFEKGGIDGLSETFIQYWIQGLKDFEKISPEDYKMCRDQYGLNVIKKIRKEGDQGQVAQFGFRTSVGGKLQFNELKFINGKYPSQDVIDKIYSIVLVESRGMFDTDHLVKENGSGSDLILKMIAKLVDTNDTGIEKQAFAISKILEYAEISQIRFNQYEKIRVQNLLKTWGFPQKQQYGKLTIGQFDAVQNMANGFDSYVERINGIK